MSISKEKAKELYDSFIKEFPIQKLKSLKIEEYTNLERTNSFCYWMETITENLGSIWGGSSYKFGIFKIAGDNKPSQKTRADGVYAWYAKYGNTATEAYSKILENICLVANAAHEHNYSDIDTVDLGPSYKWKIAYLYSEMSLLHIYSEKALRFLAKKYGVENSKKTPISTIQLSLLALNHQNLDIFDYSEKLWDEWTSSDEYKKQMEKELASDDELQFDVVNQQYIFKIASPKSYTISNQINDRLGIKYVEALLSKPFVILSGNSGTGKTQISLQLAKSLSVPSTKSSLTNDYYHVGDKINEWSVKSVTDDTYYLTNEKEPNRIRPIQKGLLQEFVDFYKAHPNEMNNPARDGRNQIKELATAKYDKFLYGFDATLRVMAEKVLSSKNNTDIAYENFQNMLIIPVGADWTDNTKILGFYNPLKKTYESTKILDFILLARENRDIPFFLILDEMNLSHVERYFSDFLSVMESHEDIILYSKDVDCDSDIPDTIDLPENLFVTGTVNIDETTYMFSPKVLDRANVIEFIPEQADVLANFAEETQPEEIVPVNDGSAEGFLDLAKKVRDTKDLPSGSDKCKDILKGISDILEGSGFEFAFRTAKEIRLYINAAYMLAQNEGKTLTEDDYINLMDEQLLQKILPKIHGNRSQVGTLLSNLSKYAEEQNLTKSKKKLDKMLKQLETSQFTSFI